MLDNSILAVTITALVILATILWYQNRTYQSDESKSKTAIKTDVSKKSSKQSHSKNTHQQQPKQGASIAKLLQKTHQQAKEKPPQDPHFVRFVRGHSGVLTAVAYSPQGKFIATAAQDGCIRILRRSTLGTPKVNVQIIKVDFDYASHLSFTEDEKLLLVVTASDQKILIYKIPSKSSTEHHAELKASFVMNHKDNVSVFRVQAFPLLPTSLYIASMCTSKADTRVMFWGPKSGTCLASLDTAQVINRNLVISPTSSYAAVAAWTSEVKIFKLDQKEATLSGVRKVMTLRGHTKPTNDIVFIPHDWNRFGVTSPEVLVLTASADGTLKLWDIGVNYALNEEPRLVATFEAPNRAEIKYLKLNPLSAKAASEGQTKRLDFLWVYGNNLESATLKIDKPLAQRDASRLLSSDDVQWHRGDTIDLSNYGTLRQLIVSPDGKEISTLFADAKNIKIWQVPLTKN